MRRRARVVLIMIANMPFTEFDEFKDMPLGSGYKKMKEFNKLLTGFKSAKTMKRNKTQEEAHYEKCRQTL